YRWRPRPITLAGLALFSLFSYPGGRGLILGQVSHLVYFLQVLALWALVKNRDRLAGFALACSTFKPQMGVLFVPLLLLWALSQRRWRLIVAFSVTLLILIAASFLLQPDWVQGFWYQITLYPTYIEVSTPAWVMTQYWLNLGSTVELIVNIVAYLGVLWTWFELFIRRYPERFLWTVMIALTVTHLVGLRTASPHFVVFTIPLIFYLHNLAKRRKGGQMALLLLALWLLPWLHFLLTIGGNKFEHPTVFLPLPILTLIALIVTRRRWWSAPSLTDTQQS
ncbi:MAG TPA: glycosyltransferase family 87 protein, partial [Phototrophicaceae bacterium]|nr:glycosyltransferase family 87 protein [Phototrophicaceae bacterium]